MVFNGRKNRFKSYPFSPVYEEEKQLLFQEVGIKDVLYSVTYLTEETNKILRELSGIEDAAISQLKQEHSSNRNTIHFDFVLNQKVYGFSAGLQGIENLEKSTVYMDISFPRNDQGLVVFPDRKIQQVLLDIYRYFRTFLSEMNMCRLHFATKNVEFEDGHIFTMCKG